jgi:hypothetical protein
VRKSRIVQVSGLDNGPIGAIQRKRIEGIMNASLALPDLRSKRALTGEVDSRAVGRCFEPNEHSTDFCSLGRSRDASSRGPQLLAVRTNSGHDGASVYERVSLYPGSIFFRSNATL